MIRLPAAQVTKHCRQEVSECVYNNETITVITALSLIPLYQANVM